MRSSIFTSLAILATSLYFASADLGINCRGSNLCKWAQLNNKSPTHITTAFRDAINESQKDNATVYNSGEHIICDGTKVCMFLQGATLMLKDIKPLLQALITWECKTCGSVPIHFVDQRSNDPRSGILTVNYVRDTRCDGNCIHWKRKPKGGGP
ncbi:hypothetical protein MMC22_008100 [Lobaria immixta]|nr:hypothetical protein [Lobaria immixta]